MTATIRNLSLLLALALATACSFKPKEELYMERGLDILSNKKQVNFKLFEGVEIEQIGVIRDKKEDKKVIVFMLSPKTDSISLAGYKIGLRAGIKGDENNTRTERWDFNPKILSVKSYKYLTREITLKEDKIQKLSVFLYRNIDSREQRQGNVLTVENLLTYND